MKKSLLYPILTATILGVSATGIIAGESASSEAGYQISVLPASGTTVKQISQITLVIPYEIMGEIAMPETEVSKITLTKEGSDTPIKATGYGEGSEAGIPVIFDPAVTEGGTYTLSVPAGVIVEAVYDETKYEMVPVENGKVNAPLTATYTISADAPSIFDNYTLDPESGKEVESLSVINLLFNDMPLNSLYMAEDGKAMSVTNIDNGKEYNVYPVWDWSYEGEKGVMFNLTVVNQDEEPISITEAGTYVLWVEAGAFAKDGEASPEIMAEYTVTGSGSGDKSLANYTLDPVSGEKVKKLSSVIIAFTDYGMTDMIQIAEGADVDDATLSMGTKQYIVEARQSWDGEHKQFELTFKAGEEEAVITEAGTYNLTIPAGYFEFNSQKSPAITAQYTVDPTMVKEFKYTADPADGSKNDFPGGLVLPVTFSFENADEVSYEQYNSSDIAGIRVTYNGNSVKEVANAFGEEEENIGWQLYDNWGGSDAIIRVNTKVLDNTPGVLAIEIDKGRFTIDGEPSPAIEYSCSFGDFKEYTWTLLPGNTEPLSDLTEFTLSFTNAETATVNDNDLYITLGDVPGIPVVTKVENAEHPTFKIKYENGPLRNGYYTLYIGEGSFTIDGNQRSPEISRGYTYRRDAKVNWTVTPSPEGDLVINTVEIPAPGDTPAKTLKQIYPAFAFDPAESLSINYEQLNNIVMVLNGVTLTKQDYTWGTNTDGDNNVIWFEISGHEAITPGTLKITLPAGLIILSGEPSTEPISHEWNVVDVKTYTYTLTPDGKAPAASLAEITVAFPETATGELWNKGFISFKDKNYNWLNCTDVEAVAEAKCATFKMNFNVSNIKENVVYTLTVREGAFTLDGAQESPFIEQAYTYTKTSGIINIPADANGKFTAVDLNGRVIVKDGDAAALRNLTPGVYIINNKKIIIR